MKCCRLAVLLIFLLHYASEASRHTRHRLRRRLSTNDYTIYFMFMVETRITNELIWSEYFNNFPNQESGDSHHEIVVHSSNPSSVVLPVHFKATNISSVPSKSCENVIGVMVSMLKYGTNRPNSHPNDVYIFLSGDSIPVKPYHELRNYFDKNTNSALMCIAPPSDWEFNDISTSKRVVKHSQWIVLRREEALRALLQYDIIARPNEIFDFGYKYLTDFNSDVPRCLDEYWFYRALFGEIDLQVPATFKALNISTTTEQGSCLTYEYNDYQRADFGSVEYIAMPRGTHIKNLFIVNPTTDFLMDLRKSPMYFFARKFNNHDPTTHVRGRNGEKMTLLQATKHLEMYNTSSSTSSSTKQQQSTSSSSTNTATAAAAGDSKLLLGQSRRGGDKGGLKVLVVSIDDRQLHDKVEDNDYVTMTSLLLSDYCKYQGYDYIKFTPNSTDLSAKVHAKYGSDSTTNYADHKYGTSSFNSGLKQFRASSWSKLPPLWHLASTQGDYYDYIWFFDSDATINPTYRERSLYDALQEWKSGSNPKRQVYYGPKDPTTATFVFMSNFPWRDDLPCAGIIIFKPKQAEPMLREWWDYNIPDKNFNDFMEQDALWHMLEATMAAGSETDFLLSPRTVSLVTEVQFPSAWYGVNNLWTTHVPNYNSFRGQYFKYMLKDIGLYPSGPYTEAVHLIQSSYSMNNHIFDLAEAMEASNEAARAASGAPRRTVFPPTYSGRADDIWHVPKNTHLRPAPPPLGETYNGFLMSIPPNREIWLVINGTRHSFPSWDSFVKSGYDLDMVLKFRQKNPENNIPTGPELVIH